MWTVFDYLMVFDCDSIDIESSAERKQEKKRVWTKRKEDEKNQMLCHWCFWFTTNALMYEAWKTGECMDKKRVIVEEWKARRKEWKKKRRKKGKWEKVGFGKSPFCFCLTVCLPLPFFPCTHHITRSHSPTTYHIT